MSKSSKSRPKRTQMHPKRTPESFQDQRCDQRNPEKVSRGGPKAPEGAQRPTKAEKYEIPAFRARRPGAQEIGPQIKK